MSDHVMFLDTTLRVDAPSNGADFTLEAKLEIAAELAKTGIDVIEAGRPAASAEEEQSVRRVAKEIRDVRVGALARSIAVEIECAADALRGAAQGRLHVYIPSGDVDLSTPSDGDRSALVAKASAMVRLARNLACEVEFSLQGATAAAPWLLAEIVRAALSAGAVIINVSDPGLILPDELALRIGALRREVPELEAAVLSFHGHDDLGLATANAIAAVRAGARQIEVAVNGISQSERNTSLQQVVRVIEAHAASLGVTTRVDTSRLRALSELVTRRGGVAPPPLLT